jgi:predicted SAM-dependent methyltransferase
MTEASGFGYPHFRTLALCVPWSGRRLPPELPMAYKACAPPMNSNTIYFETHARPIDQARQWFAEQAIKHDAKYIFFWDEDVLLPPHALRELMFIAENWKNVGTVAGIYCLKINGHPEPLVFKSAGAGPSWDWKVGEVFECGATGLGCALIRTELFKDIEKPWFRTVDDLSPYLDNIPGGEQWTEDLYFFTKLRASKKWKIVAHGGLVMPHLDVNTGKYYELPPDSKPARHLVLPVGKKKILDIGPGEAGKMKTQEGTVVTVDIRDGLGVDYRCDFRKMPFANEEFDIVHSSQALEHIPRRDVSDTLDEWIRVLKKDGELRLAVPNLEWACKRILAGDVGTMVAKPEVSALDVLYAQQQYAEDFHMNGWTPKTLEKALRDKGFKEFIVDTPSFLISIRAWRVKPKEVKGYKSTKVQK